MNYQINQIERGFKSMMEWVVSSIRINRIVERQHKIHESYRHCREASSKELKEHVRYIRIQLNDLEMVALSHSDINEMNEAGIQIDSYTEEIQKEYKKLKQLQDPNWFPEGLTMKDPNQINSGDFKLYNDTLNEYRLFAKSKNAYVPKELILD